MELKLGNILLRYRIAVAIILSCGLFIPGENLKAALPDNGDIEGGKEAIPFRMPRIELPDIPSNEVSIADFGAVSGGETINTKSINDAIVAVANKGGGKVVVPAGIWLSGPIVLRDKIELHLESNAILLFSPDADLYPLVETSFEGLDMLRCQSPISAIEASDIAITGNGVIDGGGDAWRPVKRVKLTEGQWNNLVNSGGVVDSGGKTWYPDEGALKASVITREKQNDEISKAEWMQMKRWLRPVLLGLTGCSRVLLTGVTFRNSPSWCLHPLCCDNLTIDNVKVFNPWYSQNGDALDIESCSNAIVQNCLFDAGDDAICLKSGKDEDGRKRGKPCSNIIIKNNTVLHGHGGFVIGSEMSGGINNVYVSDCTFIGTDIGLRFKSTRGRGGAVEDIYINGIKMVDITGDAIVADMYYAVKEKPGAPIPAVSVTTPVFRNIYMSDISCNGAGKAVSLRGLPEMPLKNFVIDGMNITSSKKGISANYVEGLVLNNVNVVCEDTCKLKIENSSSISVDDSLYDEITLAELPL